MEKSPTRSFLGLHHLKLPTSNLQEATDFYTKILPFTHLEHFDHKTPAPESKLFATMLEHPQTNILLEIRNSPHYALKQEHWDPITWAVGTHADLEEWAKWFDETGIRRSKVFVGFKGWVLCCEDPDKRVVRLYCNEEHEWTERVDHDEYWLG